MSDEHHFQGQETAKAAQSQHLSKIAQNQSQMLNFKLTVLETYWEFEARTGTVVKLTVSTFTSVTFFS